MARTFRILAKSLSGFAAVATVLAMSAPAQAQRFDSHGRRPPNSYARPMPDRDHYHRPPPVYRGGYHGGYRGHYRGGGGDDGDGLLFGAVLGLVAGAAIVGAMQAPPAVIYGSPPPPPPAVYSGY